MKVNLSINDNFDASVFSIMRNDVDIGDSVNEGSKRFWVSVKRYFWWRESISFFMFAFIYLWFYKS